MENTEDDIKTEETALESPIDRSDKEWNEVSLDFEAREKIQDEDYDDFLTLILPRAHTWHTGMKIKDKRGKTRFYVLETEVSKVTFGGRPTFCTVLGDSKGNPQAVVQGETGFSNNDSCFSIYTNTPSYEGQEPKVHLGDVCVKETDMYLYGEARLDRVDRCTAHGHQMVTMLQPKLSRAKLITSKREIEFYLAGRKELLMVKRDQFHDTLLVAPGASLLVGACLAFAFDRMVKPFGGKVDQEESLENSSASFDVVESLNQCSQRSMTKAA